MCQAIGGFESRRAQKNFSVRLLSRQPNPGSKTGTNGPLEPGQMGRSVVVGLIVLYHIIIIQHSFGDYGISGSTLFSFKCYRIMLPAVRRKESA